MALPGELDGRRVLRTLRRLGWQQVRQKGSHHTLVHPERDHPLVIAHHGRIPRHIVRRILRAADIDEHDFLAAL